MRLIDADALFSDVRNCDFSGEEKLAITFVVNRQPKIDAEPVKHARWEFCSNLMGEYYKCSECGYKVDVPTCMGEPIFTYCPYCGAKMDGDTNNET